MDTPTFVFEDLQIFQNRFSVGARSFDFSQVRSIKGGASKSTISFVPMTKSSGFFISLTNGEHFHYSEDSRFSKAKRHKDIQYAFGLIRKSTFQARLENLMLRLREQRFIELVTRMELNFGRFIGDTEISQVILHCDAFLESRGLKINLKAAAKDGTLWLGTESHSLNYSRQSFDPNQVVVSAHKPGFTGPHKESITFYPINEDVDIAQALIRWLAEGQNTLC